MTQTGGLRKEEKKRRLLQVCIPDNKGFRGDEKV